MPEALAAMIWISLGLGWSAEIWLTRGLAAAIAGRRKEMGCMLAEEVGRAKTGECELAKRWERRKRKRL